MAVQRVSGTSHWYSLYEINPFKVKSTKSLHGPVMVRKGHHSIQIKTFKCSLLSILMHFARLNKWKQNTFNYFPGMFLIVCNRMYYFIFSERVSVPNCKHQRISKSDNMNKTL